MKKIALFLLALTVCSAALSAGKTKSESIALKSARKTVLQVKVDGAPVKVTWFADNYVTRPNRPEDQKINIYVPETATKASPIVLYVNNAGWQANGYPENTLADGQDYDGSGGTWVTPPPLWPTPRPSSATSASTRRPSRRGTRTRLSSPARPAAAPSPP